MHRHRLGFPAPLQVRSDDADAAAQFCRGISRERNPRGGGIWEPDPRTGYLWIFPVGNNYYHIGTGGIGLPVLEAFRQIGPLSQWVERPDEKF